MQSVIAIFDIGKSSKKFILLNRDYQVVHQDIIGLKEVPDDDGFPSENLDDLTRWVKVTFREVSKMPQYDIEAVNFTTYGSGIVNLAENGKPVTPLYNYLKPYPQDLLEDFLKKYGDKETLGIQTASPIFGFLNAGLQIYYLKHKKPDLFNKVKYSLHFPQYLSYLFTGKLYSEITSIGCHTALWDFVKQHPHNWVYKEKLMTLFPPLINTFNSEKIRYKTKQISCGIGVHDSSAALIPYQLLFEEPFILTITGTWNITFNPYSSNPLSADDLSRDCLSYINYRNQPVRASRIYLGKEHFYQKNRIAQYFHKDEDYYKTVKFDGDLIKKLIKENNRYKKFYPEMTEGTGPFPQKFLQRADLKLFDNFDEAYHQMILDLVYLQVKSIELAKGNTELNKLFFAGRFCNNDIFVRLLSTWLNNWEIYTPLNSSVTSLGAAITMHSAWNIERNLKEILLFRKCEPVRGIKLKDYSLFE
jgi:sugar (pentulose or hexulose) kinase